MEKIKKNLIPIIILLLISIFILLQSPLSPFAQDVTEADSAVFIYGGNRIREGQILYKDFFDHKGPFLYILEVVGLGIAGGDTIRNMDNRSCFNVCNTFTII